MELDDEDLETYNIRGGTIDYGKEYEYLVAAYYALHFSINDQILDFKLSTNNKDFGDFDDVVVELTFKNNDRRVLALQLKHHANEKKNQALASFVGEKGDFSLFKYCEQFKVVKATCEKKYLLDFNKYCFILYTNSALSDFVEHVGKEKVEVDKQKIQNSEVTIIRHDVCAGGGHINTYPQTTKSIYRFEDAAGKLDSQFLQQFLLYTKQKHAKVILEEILDDFQRIFKVEDRNIARNYLLFFKNWYQGVFGQKDKSFKLSKSDVRITISELVLSSYMVNFTPQSSDARSSLLVEAMKKFEVSVVNSSEEAFSVVKNKINLLAGVDVKKILESKPKLYDYLRKFGLIVGRNQNFGELTQKQMLLILWYLNLAPLFLEVGAKIGSVLPVLEFSRNRRNFVLLGDISREDFSGWNVFQHVGDLEEGDKILEAFSFLLQGRHEVAIKELASVRDVITLEKLLQSLANPLLLGKKKEELPQNYMTRLIPKIVLQTSFVDESEDLVVVSCNGSLDNFQKSIKTNTVEVRDYLLTDDKYVPKKFSVPYYRQFVKNSNYENKKFILVAELTCSNEDFAKIVARNPQKNCHHVSFTQEGNLEWVQSTSNIKEVKKYQQISRDCIKDEEIFEHFHQEINVLCADPGMGKSVMVDFLTNVAPKDKWTIKIDLNLHYKLFQKGHTPRELLDYFLTDFSKDIFEDFYNQKKVVILWDSFDEMPQEIVKVVLKIIKDFRKLGFKQWVMGRYHYRDVLEETFQVISLTLLQLTEEEQREYVYRRLKAGLPDNVFAKVIEKMYENLEVLSKCDYLNFAGVPLQVYMLTETFLLEPEKYMAEEVRIVTITDIYQNFLDGKFRTLYKKMNPDLNRYLTLQIQENYKKDRLTQYRAAALKYHLDSDDFDNLNLDCDELIEDIIDGRDNLGIIVKVDEDRAPIFAHRTYSEYLVASWFFDNIRKKKDLFKILFKEDFINIRLMFDVITAKRSRAHLALLYQNYAFFDNCPSEELLSTDFGGRNLLHLICSWGPRCSLVPTVNNVMDVSYKEAADVDTNYIKILNFFLRVINPKETDGLFHWDATTYADKSQCLLPIETIGEFKTLNNFKDIPTISHYAIMHGFSKLFKFISNKIPYLKYADGSTLLHACAKYDRPDFISKLLSSWKYRFNINNANVESETAIDIASKLGHLATMKVLLDKGANVNGKYFRPLYKACKGSHLGCCLELLNRGAGYLNGALLNACYGKSPEIIELLVSKGADVNCQHYENKNTPLLTASTKGNTIIAKKLLQLGADPKIQDKDGYTPLDFAFALKHEDVAYEIIKADRGVIEKCDSYNIPPLRNAITRHFDRVVPLLIKQGVDVNRLHYLGPPLHSAVMEDKLSYVEALLEAGASSNFVDEVLYMPLASVQSVPIMECLIQHGADINLATPDKVTPLHFAASADRLEVVKRFVELGADVNFKDKDDRTPLDYAAKENLPHVVEFLLQNGAHVDNDSYSQALFQAAVGNSESCFSQLLQSGVDINKSDGSGRTILHFVCLMNRPAFVRILLDAGSEIDVCDHDGYTPLCMAVIAGSSAAVEELLQRGASLDLSTESPLHLAAFFGDLVTVGLLLKAGADPNKLCEGITPLYRLALKKDYKMVINMIEKEQMDKLNYHINDNHEECIKLLIDSDADVNAEMENSLTALHLYTHNQQFNFMEILVKGGASVNCQDKYKLTPLHYCAIHNFNKGAFFLIKHGARVNICDSFGKTPLSWAVENQNRDLMELLVNSGADVNYRPKKNSVITTPLIIACSNLDASCVTWLLEKGADVNQSGDIEKNILINVDDFHFSEDLLPESYKNGKNLVNDKLKQRNVENSPIDNLSPVNLTTILSNEKILDLLLSRGGDVNKIEKNGWNSFLFAFFGPSTPGIVQKLLQAGASVNVTLENGFSPLWMIFLTRNELVFQYLIYNGADVNHQNSTTGVSILHICSQSDNNVNFTKYLLIAGANVNITDNNNATPLHWACLSKSVETANILLDNNADINHEASGPTPLATAVTNNNVSFVKLLCERGANPNIGSKDGMTPLHLAVFQENNEIVDLLLEHEEICVNFKSDTGITPLIIACSKGNLTLVQKLINKGAIVNISNEDGPTPLLMAASSDSFPVVEYLCQKGANVNCQLADGRTSINIACGKNNYNIVYCLLKFGASPNIKDKDGVSPLTSAILDAKNLDLVKLLHENGADIFETFSFGGNLLHPSATVTTSDILNYLIQNGVSVNAVNKNGETCLHSACLYGNYENAKLLIEHGVDVNVLNKKGDSALRNAIGVGDLNFVKLLVENGADVDVPNLHGNSALFAASAVGDLDVVEFLHSRGARINIVDEDGDLPLHDAARYGHFGVVKFLVEKGRI